MADDGETMRKLTAMMMLNEAILHALVGVLVERKVLRPAQLRILFDTAEERLHAGAAATPDSGAGAIALGILQLMRRDALDS